jgi:hypothetical protein
MTDEKDKDEGRTTAPAKNPGKDPGKDPRQDRLKQALRQNLKRRKSQARERSGRGDATIAPSNRDDLSPHDGGGKKPGQ